MKLGKASIERYSSRQRSTGKTQDMYRVRWRVYPSIGPALQAKRSGFARKGLAEAFVDQLRRAEVGTDGWTIDRRGHPVPPAATTRDKGPTVLELVDLYVKLHWYAAWPSPATRRKNRGRLLVLAAVLLDDPAAAERLCSALEEQNPSRQGKRPEPRHIEQWAARWLHAFFADPNAGAVDVTSELEAGRKWLEARSVPVADVDDEALVRVRRQLCDGRPFATARTYWTVVEAFLSWLVESGRLDRNPSAGMPALRRDIDAELVDPMRVPTETEAWALAEEAEQKFGLAYQALILVLFYLAARIGEAVALVRSDVDTDGDGVVFVTIRSQESRTTARCSDDGSTRARRSPKARTSGPGARRTVPLPENVGRILLAHLDVNVADKPNSRLFVGARGGWLDPSYFRATRWNVLVEGVFPPGHRLDGIHPHAMRHGGMTNWLNRNVRVKTIQRWGGWHSLKVMLDVYAAVLPEDPEHDRKAIRAVGVSENDH